VEALQAELGALKQKHDRLEVTVKTWNTERRRIDEQIKDAELEMLDCRVQVWRLFTQTGQQLEIF
jgi:predicted  nucleic acid-binding Zn-ribbon protein